MIPSYLKMSIRALRSSRWRTFLTMLGVVVGVASVVTIISIGEGVKKQITKQVNIASGELITIRPGRLVERDSKGNITKVNYQNILTSGTLTEKDVDVIEKSENISAVVPFGVFSGVSQHGTTKYNEALLIGTTPDLPVVLDKKVNFGSFFSTNDSKSGAAVIGSKVAEQLFKENSPVGRSFMIRGKEVIVRGILEQSKPNPTDLGINYDNAIFLPYEFAKQVAGGQLQIYQILTRSVDGKDITKTVNSLSKSLKDSHNGDEDFTILQSADTLAIASNALNLMTVMIATMAGISLIVGGIGIMNIMLVAVSERTHEIGVRKSIGATNGQIRGQFLTEAVLISGLGGFVGILVSLLANYMIRITTNLEPIIDIELMTYAIFSAVFIGSFFGLAPAIKAARKDPIEALRRVN